MTVSIDLLRAALLVSMAVAPAVSSGRSNAAARPPKRLLVVTVTKGFRHDSIPLAEETIQMLGNKTGAWTTDFVRTDEEMAQKMTRKGLSHYDAVVFANTTGVLPLPDPQGFLDYIKSGHGFAAMHSGSDTFHQWPGAPAGAVSEYVRMLGGEFQEHHSQSAVDIHILDPRFPATAPLIAAARADGASTDDVDLHQHTVVVDHIWKAFDEIYLLKNNDPA
ncbi:MAG TPA: ThuA domain-containing protein, partial [Chthonomonadales bacterium]|nr:ThuA domain-containing protein [Chthonomonadales bacterium]